MHLHVPYRTEPYLLAKVGFRAAMCPVAPDPASLIGRPLMPPCVLWLQTQPPCMGGALVHHVSYMEGFGVPGVLQLRILPPYRGGL
jgi:hypothetical protein